MTEELSDNAKLLVAVALGAVVADMWDDVKPMLTPELRQKHVNNIVYKLRKLDQRIMDNADAETIENQIDIQRAFRQWARENFQHVPGNEQIQ